MNPIKPTLYSRINELLRVLNQSKILYPKDNRLIYNILCQIYNEEYSELNKEEDSKKKLEKIYNELTTEFCKNTNGKKHTFFLQKANEFERELRVFANDHIKEDEFSVGGV